MRYASQEEMTLAHIQDIVDTVAPAYHAHINAAFGVVLHLMTAFHKSNLHRISQDILGLCEHYVARCMTLEEEQKNPTGETVH